MLTFLAMLWLRDTHKSLPGRLAALFLFAIVSYLLCPPLDRHWQLGILELPIFFGCFGAALFFYLMSRAVFDDQFRLRPWHAVILLTMEAMGFWHRYGGPPAAITSAGEVSFFASFDPGQIALVLHQMLSLGLTLAALILALTGKAADLVEARRHLRTIFVAISGIYILVVLGIEILLRDQQPGQMLEMLNIAAIFCLTFGFALTLTQLKPMALPPSPVEASISTTTTTPEKLDEPPDGTENLVAGRAEDALLAALKSALEADLVYRVEGLSIRQLAQRLGTQEYRLRRLINGRMGHRNFNEFLIRYRIDEVRARFADPGATALPILTIALESGFSSLGPFNRAFKDITGMTPRAYRASPQGKTPRE
ncbi:MAG: helix-turn-helix domain-containing protein [Alphaproteobacteria bacterium]|nr:helix-turn-helix domain-containing protein [Alphaproteobacteria bacterium]